MKTEQLFKSPCLLTLVFSTLLSGLTTAQTLVYDQATKKFSITGTLPALHKPGAYFKVFVNTGEGHYFIGDLNNPSDPDPDLSDFTYTGGIQNAYAELTPAYDDTHPPGGYHYISSSITPQTGTSSTSSMTNAVFMEASRSIVRDHEITFVATVKNTCSTGSLTGSFTFSYDAAMFNSVKNNGVPDGSSSGQMVTSISGVAAGSQLSVFFTLRTKSSVGLGTSPAFAPRVGFASPAGSACGVEGSYEVTGMTVLASHDPNHKYANIELISQNGEEMIYQVTFQNDGAAPEYFVVVNDELDPYLKNQVPEAVPPYPAELLNPPFPVAIAPRTWQWRFDFNGTPGLRGTKETDYLAQQFPESHTKRSFKFKVKLDTFAPCNAVLNRATIYFKCQAPIETELSLVPIPCVQGDSIDSCQVMSNVWLPGWTGVADGAPLPALLSSAWFSLNDYPSNLGYRYKWYPSENVTAPWQLNPGLKMARTGVYTLVVSLGCRRHIFRVPVTTTAGVSTQSILVQDNPNDCVARLFIIGGTPPYTVNWTFTNSNGSSGTATGTVLNLLGKSGVQATVVDSNGCTVVFTPIAANCNTWWSCWWVILAAILAAIGAGIWFLKKSKKISL